MIKVHSFDIDETENMRYDFKVTKMMNYIKTIYEYWIDKEILTAFGDSSGKASALSAMGV